MCKVMYGHREYVQAKGQDKWSPRTNLAKGSRLTLSMELTDTADASQQTH